MKTNKLNRLLVVVLSALLALTLAFSIGSLNTVSASTDVFESFDDYDTGYNRKGEAGKIYEQAILWAANYNGVNVEAGNPVGTSSGKSLKLTQMTGDIFNAWSNGTKDSAKYNQTGAKYVKYYVRNLSAEAKEMGVIVTDMTQNMINSFAGAGNTIPDAEQEHWIIDVKKPVVLETIAGQKSIVYSMNGNHYPIPAGFEGSVSVPLEGMVNPSWWLAEVGHDYANKQLDLDKIFMVSFLLPQSSTTYIEDEDTWSIFEVDNVSFGKDDSVSNYIATNAVGGLEYLKSIVKTKSGSAITVDYMENKLIAKSAMTYGEFKNCFELDGETDLIVRDSLGFDILSDNQSVEDGNKVMFVKDGLTYNFTFSVQAESTGTTGTTNKDSTTTTVTVTTDGGCGSQVNGGNYLVISLMALTVAGVVVIARKRSSK